MITANAVLIHTATVTIVESEWNLPKNKNSRHLQSRNTQKTNKQKRTYKEKLRILFHFTQIMIARAWRFMSMLTSKHFYH